MITITDSHGIWQKDGIIWLVIEWQYGMTPFLIKQKPQHNVDSFGPEYDALYEYS